MHISSLVKVALRILSYKIRFSFSTAPIKNASSISDSTRGLIFSIQKRLQMGWKVTFCKPVKAKAGVKPTAQASNKKGCFTLLLTFEKET